MKLGLQLGYWGAGPPTDAAELVRGRRARPGSTRCSTAESWGSDAFTPLAWWGARDVERVRLGHVGRAAVGADADRVRDARADPRPPLRRPVRARARACPGRRSSRAGTARRSASRWPAPGVRRRSCARCWPARRRCATTARTTRCPTPARARSGWASRCARSPTRCAPTCRSGSAPRARATSRWPPRSPTAGSRSTTPPRLAPHLRGVARRGLRRPGARRTREDFEVAATARSSSPTTAAAGFAAASSRSLALYLGGMGAPGMNFHADAVPPHGVTARWSTRSAALFRAGRPGRGGRRRAGRAGRRDRDHRRRPATCGPRSRAGRRAGVAMLLVGCRDAARRMRSGRCARPAGLAAVVKHVLVFDRVTALGLWTIAAGQPDRDRRRRRRTAAG